MRIVVCGDFSRSFHTEVHVARDLRALGHAVTCSHGIPASIDADLLLLQGNGGRTGNIRPRLREIEATGCQSASYHLDLFAGLARESRVGIEPMWQVQTVFTPDGGSTDFFAAKGIDHRWLPAAVVSDECQPGNWRAEYDHDVVFVGSQTYHREHPWRGQLLRFLTERYGNRFRVYDHHPPTRGQDLNDLYATARVVVGDSLTLAGHRDYVSDRLFESLGRGAVLVFPRVPGLNGLGFEEGEHYRGYDYGDTEGLAATIDALLASPDEARLMAKRGQTFVAENHTYVHRMQQLLLELDLA